MSQGLEPVGPQRDNRDTTFRISEKGGELNGGSLHDGLWRF